MRFDRLRIFASIVAATLLFLFLSVVHQGFTVFEYTPSGVEKTLIPVSGEVGHEVSQVLWGHRQLDLIVLAFLLFITGACCSSILRVERGEEK